MGKQEAVVEPRIEVIDPEMAAILREKSGAERLQIAYGLFDSARRMMTSMLRADHPDWSDERLGKEVARRLAHEPG